VATLAVDGGESVKGSYAKDVATQVRSGLNLMNGNNLIIASCEHLPGTLNEIQTQELR
jgi:hypothetical protein